MIKNYEIKEKKINRGIELLRTIICFRVLLSHCSSIKKQHLKYFKRCFHVPTFFVISFYFYYPILYVRKKTKISLRFQRLVYPYIFWPLFVFILNNILFQFSFFPQHQIKLSIKDLYLQILTGTKYYRIFWFQFNLIFLSLFFAIFSFIFEKNLLFSLELLGLISFSFIFSKINLYIFLQYSELIQMSIGRLNESIPLAVLGCFFSSKNLLTQINNFNFSVYFILVYLVILLLKNDLFIGFEGFGYSNTLLFIFSSTILFMLFGSIKLGKLVLINKIIENTTKFTGGIYYIHQIFPKYL